MLNEHVTIHADEAMMWSSDRVSQFQIIVFHHFSRCFPLNCNFFTYVTASGSTYISHHFQDKIEIREGSWFEPLKDMEGKLAGLVSNPPYTPSNDISGLQAEVGKHEPRVALDGGIDGMDALLHLCDGADLLLKSGGFFAFEVWPLFIYYYKVLSNLCVFLIVLLLSPYQ
jgi:hypothetical protein